MANNLNEEQFEGYQNEMELEDEYYADDELRTQFEVYSDDEMGQRWGNLDIRDILMEIESQLNRSKRYFFSKRKRVIDGEELTNIAIYAQKKLPRDIEEARAIKQNGLIIVERAKQNAAEIIDSANKQHDETIAAANAQANRIIEEAKAKAAELVAAHSITQGARAAAEKIQADTKAWDANLRAKTKDACNAYITGIMQWSSDTVNGANSFVQSAMRDSLNHISNTYSNIETALQGYNMDLQKKVNEFSRGPGINLDKE